MRVLRVFFLIATLLLILAFSGEPSRASSPANISMTLSNPTCRQAKTSSGTCVINLRSLNANSDDPTFSHVEISINGKVRAYYSAFFESSVNANNAMLGNGLQVPCGLPNAGGDPNSGYIYHVVVSAYLAGGPAIIDSANVTCPYIASTNLLPFIRK